MFVQRILGRHRKLLASIMVSGAIKGFGTLFTFLSFVAVARATSVEEFGRFSIAFALATILSFLLLGGQHRIVLKYFPKYELADDDGASAGFTLRAASRNLAVFIAAGALCLVLLAFAASLLDVRLATDISLSVLMLTLVVAIVMALSGRGRTAIKPSGQLNPGEPLEHYFFARNQMVQTSVLVVDRQSAVDARFKPDILVGEDLDFCLAIEAAGIPWERIDEPLSIWFDVPQEGRSADYRGDLKAAYKNFRTWRLLSERGRYAYEGTVGAFHTAPIDRFAALRMLLAGPLKGGVKLPVTGRQFVRCFVPRKIYHQLVGAVLGLKKSLRKTPGTPSG